MFHCYSISSESITLIDINHHVKFGEEIITWSEETPVQLIQQPHFWYKKFCLCITVYIRPPLVEMLFIVIFKCLCEYEARGNYWLLIIFSSFIFYVEMRLYIGKRRYYYYYCPFNVRVSPTTGVGSKLIYACTIWALWKKEISFLTDLFMYENHYYQVF